MNNQNDMDTLIEEIYDEYCHYLCKRQVSDILTLAEAHLEQKYGQRVAEAFISVITKAEGGDHTAPCLVFPDEAIEAIHKVFSDE